MSLERAQHHEIELLAYELWQKRGKPFASSEEDWFRAQAVVIARARSTALCNEIRSTRRERLTRLALDLSLPFREVTSELLPIHRILRVCSACLFAVTLLWAQGPPFQTDDPVPVDLHHYEFYIFSSMDGTTAEMDSTGPAFEFNWGALPRVQLHAILPLGAVAPSNNPIYLPGGSGPFAFGLTDSELGVKIALFKETQHLPQIGTFTMFEIPTGNSASGLGVGKVWYKLPIWLQKNIGNWLLDGGAGYQVVPQTGYRNFPYAALLLKYKFGERLELGVEVFSHAREGFAAAQTQAATMIDIGDYYHFKDHPGKQVLFCYGHSIAGQTKNYAYVGMYWTWERDNNTQR